MSHRYLFAILAFAGLTVAAFAEVRAQTREAASVTLRVAASELRRYESGQWATVQVEGSNAGDEDATAMLAGFLGDDTQTQYARRFWIPARSRRTTWLPIRIPETPADVRQIELSALALDSSSARELLQSRSGDPLIEQSILFLDHESVKTATILSKPEYDGSGSSRLSREWIYETVVASRESNHLPRAMMDLVGDFLPAAPGALDALDQVVLASDRIAADTAGAAAVREWVRRGGRLWIMLDQVREETVAAILGNHVCYDVVDRVELTEFTITDLTAPARLERDTVWLSEVPVELVRVFTDSPEIHCTIDGWPAAFWHPLGDGEVLFTTLGARGWVLDPKFASGPVIALRSVATRLYRDRVESRLPDEAIKPILTEQIGYRIPSRRLAAVLLGFHGAALLGVGIWLARRRELERLAWIVPALTLLAAGALLVIGMRNSRSVPSMMSSLQLVRMEFDGDQASVHGLGAIYAQQTSELALETERNGVAVPVDHGPSGSTRRLVFDDEQRARWINLRAASGSVRFVNLRASSTLDAPVSARGQFGPEGLEGHLEGGASRWSDLVIVSPPAPSLTVAPDPTGDFRCSPGHVLSPDQYLADTLLSDEQRRRQSVYRRLLDTTDEMPFPPRPTLFAWSDVAQSPVSLPQEFQLQGRSLVAVPLRIDRTSSRTAFQVPATFIRVESFQGRHGTSSVYDPRSGKWMQDVIRPSTTDLRFVLPQQVQPCRLSRATLTFKINAPSRTVAIMYPRGDERAVLRSIDNPNGVLRWEINDPGVLQLDPGGGLHLGIDVSPTARQQERQRILREDQRRAQAAPRAGSQMSADFDRDGSVAFDFSTWQIDYLRLDVAGETL